MSTGDARKRWLQANPEKRAASAKRWRDANPDKVKAIHADWYARNREQLKAKRKAYNLANKERGRAYAKQWRAANKEHIREVARAYKYGLKPGEFDALFQAQNGLCAICERPLPNGRGCHVDHDHATHTVRGLLCKQCNTALGVLGDSVAGLSSTLIYLDPEGARVDEHW